MGRINRLKVDLPTPWRVIPKDTLVYIIDDDTPLNQSWRVRLLWEKDYQCFPVLKAYSHGYLQPILV